MRARIAVLLICCAMPLRAELPSIFQQAALQAGTIPDAGQSGSLFSGPQTGLFAPLPPRLDAPAGPEPYVEAPPSRIDQLLSLIARAEAGPKGYDAVQYGATIKPPLPPTDMTLGEIYRWIDDTPGQPHAIGRYQFIPPTLRRVADIRGFGPETPFTPGVQDALALVLLEDAGLRRFEAGEMDRRRFMHNLARIWAGLPLPNGKSYYDGYAGNSATMTWAAFEGGMREIWAEG